MILSSIIKKSYARQLSRITDFMAKNNYNKVPVVTKKSYNIVKVSSQTKKNQNVISYVINVVFSSVGICVNVTDVNGNVLVLLTESLVGIPKEPKKYQFSSLSKIFKVLLIKACFIKNKAVSVINAQYGKEQTTIVNIHKQT